MHTFDYNQLAEDYDKWYQTPLGQQIDAWEKQLFLPYLKKIKTQNILEIGAGTGHWTSFFAENNMSVIGIDIAEKMLEQAKEKNIVGATFIKASAEDLPFENQSIDNVVAVTSLEFVNDRQQAIEEIYRVLKPGGYFIVGGLNALGSLQQKRQDDPVFKNAQFFTPESLYKILEKFGIPIIEGCIYMPNTQANLDEIIKAENSVPLNFLNIYGNFLVGNVKKTK